MYPLIYSLTNAHTHITKLTQAHTCTTATRVNPLVTNLNETFNTLIHSLYTDLVHIAASGIHTHTHTHALPCYLCLSHCHNLSSTYTLTQSRAQGVIQLSYAECESWLVVFMTHHFSHSCKVRVRVFFPKS